MCAQLTQISARQIDRRLAPVKRTLKRRQYERTRPGMLCEHHIPVKTDHWAVTTPGFTERDLVAHSGRRADGEFVHSLNVTDIHTRWVETRAVLGKGTCRTRHSSGSKPLPRPIRPPWRRPSRFALGSIRLPSPPKLVQIRANPFAKRGQHARIPRVADGALGTLGTKDLDRRRGDEPRAVAVHGTPDRGGGRPPQLQMAAALQDAVEDGLDEIAIVQDAPQAASGVFVVKIIGRRCRERWSTTWKRPLAASGP